ncbi:cupin domain-containing protein [Rhodobacter sp. SGA-6-6]|uniref:cupin domain-containing protein n=1 Tax=Rhodobacter sp. SGA-6-6 TaxID=2710882 RepID=UPI0013EA5FF1|nr:cupin domain-containing protein [Rhodobacter sp. SGA-6-6]NGM44626.1 cupin domain-containing protein [Rhodobacter sp. SGA-6-6]
MGRSFPPVILRPSERPVVQRGGGVTTIPLVTRACGSTGLINGITIFPPGGSIALHWHNCEESVMVLEGRATVEIDGAKHEMQPGDTTWVPAGVPHRFLNASESEEMRILWTYARPDATRTSAATGETRSIDEEQA